MKLRISQCAVAAIITTGLSGCVGSNAITEKLMEFNVKAVDNRYARGGLNILMSPIYGLTVAGDYLIFNSIEFWTGKNPINGKPHIFDSEVDTIIDINDDLDPSLTEAPIDPITKVIKHGEMRAINQDTIEMDVTYASGEQATLTGVRAGNQVTYFLDGHPIAQTSIRELTEYAATRS